MISVHFWLLQVSPAFQTLEMSRQTTEVRKGSIGGGWARGQMAWGGFCVKSVTWRAILLGSLIPLLSTWVPLPSKVSCFGEKKKCHFGSWAEDGLNRVRRFRRKEMVNIVFFFKLNYKCIYIFNNYIFQRSTRVSWIAGRFFTIWATKDALVTQSCLTLCDPTCCSPPGPSVHGILQAWDVCVAMQEMQESQVWSLGWEDPLE